MQPALDSDTAAQKDALPAAASAATGSSGGATKSDSHRLTATTLTATSDHTIGGGLCGPPRKLTVEEIVVTQAPSVRSVAKAVDCDKPCAACRVRQGASVHCRI